MLVTSKNCKDVYGYTPEQAVDMKILCGDTSDNISGIKGVGPKTALKFLEEYGSIREFLKSDHGDKKFPKSELEPIFKRNQLLIDLFYYLTRVNPEVIPYHDKKHAMDRITLNEIFEKYQLKSFMSSEFMKPFKQLKTYKYEE